MIHPPVPNLFPTHPPGACRLALVGEAPGAEEVLAGAPFVGSAGRLLTKVLLSVGLTRAELFIGNVCGTRPPGNDLSHFAWDGPEIQAGIKALVADLYVFRPNLIVALGNVPLHLFKAGNVPPKSSKSGFVFPFKISHWRGSLFLSTPLSSNYGGVESRHASAERHPETRLACGNSHTLPRNGLKTVSRSSARPVVASPLGGDSCDGAGCAGRVAPLQAGSIPAIVTDCTPPPLSPLPSSTSSSSLARLAESGTTPERDPSGLSTSFRGCGDSLEDGLQPASPILPPLKVLPTWHPAGVLREISKAFELRQDLRKAVNEGRFPELSLPIMNLSYGP